MPDQDQGVVADHRGYCQGDCGVEPIPAADGQNDRPGDGDTGRGGRVGSGVEQDGFDVKVLTTVVIIVEIPAEDECADDHNCGGGRADDQHGQPVNLVGTDTSRRIAATTTPALRASNHPALTSAAM